MSYLNFKVGNAGENIYSLHAFFVLLIIIIFAACEAKQETSLDKSNYIIGLTKKDTISLSLPKNIAIASNYYGTYSDSIGSSFLYQIQPMDNSINFFDLGTSKFSFKLEIPQFGPGKIGKIQGLYVKNLDSIYLNVIPHNQVILVDTALNILSKYKLGLEGEVMIAGLTQLPLLINETHMALPTFPERDYFEGTRMISYTFESRETRELFSISDGEREEQNYDILYGLNSVVSLNKNEVIVSFGIDDNLYKYDLKKGTFDKWFSMKSKYFDRTEPLQTSNPPSVSDRVTRSYYKGVFIDSVNHLIYRVASIATDRIDIDGNDNTLYDKDISVIVADYLKKEILLEDVLPQKTFDFRMGFYLRNKLYFLVNNPKAQVNEDEAIFIGYQYDSE